MDMCRNCDVQKVIEKTGFLHELKEGKRHCYAVVNQDTKERFGKAKLFF